MSVNRFPLPRQHRDDRGVPDPQPLRGPIMSMTLSGVHPSRLITVCGEVDMSNAHLLVELVEFACRRAARPSVAVDLSAVTVFGAHGISALLQAQELVTSLGGRLVLREPSPVVVYLLGVTGVLPHLDVSVTRYLGRREPAAGPAIGASPVPADTLGSLLPQRLADHRYSTSRGALG